MKNNIDIKSTAWRELLAMRDRYRYSKDKVPVYSMIDGKLIGYIKLEVKA